MKIAKMRLAIVSKRLALLIVTKEGKHPDSVTILYDIS